MYCNLRLNLNAFYLKFPQCHDISLMKFNFIFVQYFCDFCSSTKAARQVDAERMLPKL